MKKAIYLLAIIAASLIVVVSCKDSVMTDITTATPSTDTTVAYMKKAITCVSETPTLITFKAVGVTLADGTVATLTTASVAASTNTCYECILYKLTNKRTGYTTFEPAAGVDQNKISVNIFSYPTIINGVFSAVGDTLTVSAASTNNVNVFTPISAYSTPVEYIIPQK